MPNVFITPEEFVESMLEASRLTVDSLPLETVKKLAAYPFSGVAPGLNGALGVSLMMAAREKLKKLGGLEC